jgi:hypothetical protein
MSQETTNRSFDELARGLASGSISRGKALRLMGAALVGGTLSSLGIGGVAAADPPGCKRNGKSCKNDEQCCSLNCEGGKCAAACVSNGGACTTSGQCCSGNCSNGFCCPSGYVGLRNGTCAKPCTVGPVSECAAGCFCSITPSGARYCVPSRGGGSGTLCMDDSQCPTGEFCNGPAGSPEGFCAAAC